MNKKVSTSFALIVIILIAGFFTLLVWLGSKNKSLNLETDTVAVLVKEKSIDNTTETIRFTNTDNLARNSANQDDMAKATLLQAANALRAGNIDLALKYFRPDKKREKVLRLLNSEELNQLAYELENAVLVEETEHIKFYKYSWTDETGENFFELKLVKDVNKNWIIKGL